MSGGVADVAAVISPAGTFTRAPSPRRMAPSIRRGTFLAAVGALLVTVVAADMVTPVASKGGMPGPVGAPAALVLPASLPAVSPPSVSRMPVLVSPASRPAAWPASVWPTSAAPEGALRAAFQARTPGARTEPEGGRFPADSLARWSMHIAEASARYGIPAEWIERVMAAESAGLTHRDGRPIRSPKGAIGLMQLMPGTWLELRARLGLGDDPDLPRDNILAGAFYLRTLFDRFGYPGLFAAYNAGPARYERYLSGTPLPAETVAYLARVTALRTRSGTPAMPAICQGYPAAASRDPWAVRPGASRSANPDEGRGDGQGLPLLATPRPASGNRLLAAGDASDRNVRDRSATVGDGTGIADPVAKPVREYLAAHASDADGHDPSGKMAMGLQSARIGLVSSGSGSDDSTGHGPVGLDRIGFDLGGPLTPPADTGAASDDDELAREVAASGSAAHRAADPSQPKAPELFAVRRTTP